MFFLNVSNMSDSYSSTRGTFQKANTYLTNTRVTLQITHLGDTPRYSKAQTHYQLASRAGCGTRADIFGFAFGGDRADEVAWDTFLVVC